MNKQSSQGKNKLKTLPSQLTTEHQQYVFKSQCEDDYIKKLGIASPTFATTEIGSYAEGPTDKEIANKQNRISLSLKQYREKENNPKNLNFNEMQYIGEQYQSLIVKCKNMEIIINKTSQQNSILKAKLAQSMKNLQGKCSKLAKVIQSNPQLPNLQKIDLYLQMKAFKDSYNQLVDQNQKYKAENEQLKKLVKELQTLITSYTQKSEKKKNVQKQQNIEKITKMQKLYAEKLQQFQKQFQKERKDKQYTKFLKEQIQKKRIQELNANQQLQKQLVNKQNNIKKLSQQYSKLQNEYKNASQKLKACQQNFANLEQQFLKSQEEVQRLQLTLSSVQTEKDRYKYNMENFKLINQKFNQQIGQLRKQNQQFYQHVESLKLQKDKLEGSIIKHLSNQQRYTRRIHEFEAKINQTLKQMEQMKIQLEQQRQKNTNNTNRSHPQISTFKNEDEQSKKQINSRLSENQLQVIIQNKMKSIQEKYNIIVENLNKQIQQLRKNKEILQLQLDSQRGRNQKINIQLQNTYRKIQEFTCNEYEKQINRDFRDTREKDKYMKSGNIYNTTSILPLQLTRATKAAPQLKMIKDILATILYTTQMSNKTAGNIFGVFRDKQKQISTYSLQIIIDDIKKMAQQTADFFDERTKEIQSLVNRIENKQEVISKLLKFTPEQKKGCILDYLKVMENIDEYSVDQIYKATKILEEQANQWKRNVNNLLQTAQKNQEELILLRKQVFKYKSQNGVAGHKKYEQPYDRLQRFDRYDRDGPQKHERYFQIQRRRY